MMDFAGLKQMVASSTNIVFFGGAGVSTESNIPDFRSTAGIYQTKSESAFPPQVVLSRSFSWSIREIFFVSTKVK